MCAIIARMLLQHNLPFSFPKSQGELIRSVRGDRTQSVFARELNVERSCISRYESEKLGAPTRILNHCLRAIAAQTLNKVTPGEDLKQALVHARRAVSLLEGVAVAEQSADDELPAKPV